MNLVLLGNLLQRQVVMCRSSVPPICILAGFALVLSHEYHGSVSRWITPVISMQKYQTLKQIFMCIRVSRHGSGSELTLFKLKTLLSCLAGGALPDPVICLGTETGHSCQHVFILMSFILCQLDIFAFAHNRLICPCLYGSLAYSSISYLYVQTFLEDPGLLYFMYIFKDSY